MFFDRPDFDLASAKPGTFAIKPNPNMLDSLRRDYANTVSMIFGAAPTFEEIVASIDEIDLPPIVFLDAATLMDGEIICV
jgi:hypothetical protein